MSTLRPRDFQAIAFCIFAIGVALAGIWLVTANWAVAAVGTALFAAWLLTRARVRRVLRRLRGKAVVNGWDRYFQDE